MTHNQHELFERCENCHYTKIVGKACLNCGEGEELTEGEYFLYLCIIGVCMALFLVAVHWIYTYFTNFN